VKAFGGDGVTTPTARTADQTQFGLFWIESSPLGWNRIARTVSANRGLDLWENARLFGLLNLSVADAYIAHFDVKYHYNFWHPVTAVHLADSDGNPDTLGDPVGLRCSSTIRHPITFQAIAPQAARRRRLSWSSSGPTTSASESAV
jgi:hypothetical protein